MSSWKQAGPCLAPRFLYNKDHCYMFIINQEKTTLQNSSDIKTQIPTPPDIYTWEPPPDMQHPLSPFQEALILSACPPGSYILSARFHRTVRLPGPIWVNVALPSGDEQMLILRMDQRIGGVEREAMILPVLAQHGLPVPTILAGPTVDPSRPAWGAMTVLNVLPGQDLLTWSWNAPRLALRCLWTLQREIAVTGGEDILVEDEYETHADYRHRILSLMQRAMSEI